MSYICSTCDYASTTKLWKCPSCGEFGSFIVNPESVGNKGNKKKESGTVLSAKHEWRTHSGINQPISYSLNHAELDRIYPGWLRSSGVYLIAWEPGIGKSTIVLQIIQSLIQQHPSINVCYFTGEESVSQVSARVERILWSVPVQLSIYYATNIQDCLATAASAGCNLMIIDSIQMIASNDSDSAAGTPAQVKAVSEAVAHDCKSSGRTALLIGHVTKWGEIAWPKYLEHIVDVVSYLEWDRYGQYRFLRNKKNRYGSADETAVFEMTSEWLASVKDIASINLWLIQTWQEGTIVSVGLDSGRPMIVWVECLCTKTKMNYAKRLASGRDSQRLDLMIAIIEKYCKINLSFYDVYCNVPWEIKVQDHGIDLAVIAGIMSSVSGKPIGNKIAVLGEVWLGWQILPTKSHSKRIKELQWYDIIDYQTITNVRQLSQYF
jgi:DNA repair protein RadA/Sms